jgi:nucleoside-diphosphate-sugar epimerase
MVLYATGTSGTIGRHLSPKVVPLNIDLGSISRFASLPAVSSVDTIIHLAGVVGTSAVEKDYDKSYSINVLGTLSLAQYFLQSGANRFIYASTSHVYAKSSCAINEDYETSPQNSYARQKLEAESLLLELFRGSLEKLCIVRIFSVLDWDVPAFTLGGGIKQLTNPYSRFVLTNSDDIRDFLTPRFIARTLLSLSNKLTLPTVLNLCSGTGTKVVDAASRMLVASGYEIPFSRILKGHSSNPIVVGDNSKLKQILPDIDFKWTPSSDFGDKWESERL